MWCSNRPELSSRSLERFHTVVCKVCRVVGTTGFAISPKKTTSRFDNHWRNCQLFEVCLNPLKRFLSCKHFCFCFWIELPPFLQCLKQPNLFVMRWFGLTHRCEHLFATVVFVVGWFDASWACRLAGSSQGRHWIRITNTSCLEQAECTVSVISLE